MSDERPSIVILAGPNGAGKSTVAPALLEGALGVTEFVNADDIARELSALNPEGASIAAGRVMLARLRELAQQRVSFAFRLYGENASTWRLYDAFSSQPRMIANRLDNHVYDHNTWALSRPSGKCRSTEMANQP